MVHNDGAQLAVSRIGIGRPVIILAGGPGFGHRYLFNPLTELLADERQLIFFDYRGTGSSTNVNSGEHTIEQYVDDLEAVRQSTSLGEVDLIAHSFGGLVAVAYASSQLANVRRAVFVDADPLQYSDWAAFREIVASRTSESDKDLLMAISSTKNWHHDPNQLEIYFKVLLATYSSDPIALQQLSFDFTSGSYERMVAANTSIRKDLREWDFRERAKDIVVPALVISGNMSIFPHRSADDFAKLLPNAQLLNIENTGHFPFIEQPTLFQSAVSRFLNS